MYTKWWTGNSSAPRTMKGRTVVAGALCLALLIAPGCSLLPKEQVEEVLPTVNPPKLSKKPEYTVKTDTLETKVRGSGKLMATREEEVYFTEDSKRVKDIYVKNGASVKAGQLIAELDVADLESQLKQKRLQSRKDELAMIETLRSADPKAREQIEQAKLDFEMKKEDIAKLEETIAKSKIAAPFDGTVVAVYMQKGDLAKAYDAVAVIADLSQLTVAATVTADDLKKVTVGMETVVDINTAGQKKGKVVQLPNPTAAASGQGGGGFPGQTGKNQQKQRDTIDNYLLVQLDDMPTGLSRGTQLSISVITQKKENAMVIPQAALRSAGGRNYVQVVDDKGNKREVDVEVGQQTSTDVEILKGLSPGQKVVGR